MFHEVGELERFQTAKVTFKVIQGNGAIRQATYDFLLDFHCSHVFILHRYEILPFISQTLKRLRDPERIPFEGNLSVLHYLVAL